MALTCEISIVRTSNSHVDNVQMPGNYAVECNSYRNLDNLVYISSRSKILYDTRKIDSTVAVPNAGFIANELRKTPNPLPIQRTFNRFAVPCQLS